MSYSVKRPLRLLALLSLAAFSTAALSAQNWLVVDTFAGGTPQGNWTFSGGFAREVRSSDVGNFLFTTSASGNTERAYVVLPQTVNSGKVTIAFDFFAPGGRSMNQVGFGAGSPAMVARSGWLAVGGAPGGSNRFQMVDRTAGATEFLDKIPQFLAKAGDWAIDVIDPTLQGFWYNIWIVYDLEAGQFSLYSRRADDESQNAALRGTWSFLGNAIAEDYAEISRFALGAGGSGNPDAPALGGQYANIYMAVGENLGLTPTAIVLDPPSWQAIDTFVGAMPNATWMGDTNQFDLDFSAGYLHLLPTATTNRHAIWTELPQNVEFGRFTVTFDFFLNGPSNVRTDVSFAVVGDDQIALDGWNRRGGNTRLGTFGGTPQAFRAFLPTNVIAIPGAETQEQWHHAWIFYDLGAQRIDFFYAPFGSSPNAETPAASWSFDSNVNYDNFRYFVTGFDRADNAGLRLGNIYFAPDELITLSPTAGTFSPTAVWPVGDFSSSLLLGEIYYFGNGWAQWFPLVGLYADFGAIWVGELEQLSTEGWFYHAQGESWFYGISNGGSTDFYAWVDSLGQWIYISMAASQTSYYVFADPADPSSEMGWFTWGEGPVF